MSKKTSHRADYRRIVDRFHAERVERGWSQADLAKAAGWRQQYVSNFEMGVRRLDVVEYFHLYGLMGVTRAEAAAMLLEDLGLDVGQPVKTPSPRSPSKS